MEEDKLSITPGTNEPPRHPWDLGHRFQPGHLFCKTTQWANERHSGRLQTKGLFRTQTRRKRTNHPAAPLDAGAVALLPGIKGRQSIKRHEDVPATSAARVIRVGGEQAGAAVSSRQCMGRISQGGSHVPVSVCVWIRQFRLCSPSKVKPSSTKLDSI